jgi:hypothetical protein
LSAQHDTTPAATLADKIEWLIQNMWPANTPPPRNNVETAAAISNATGEDMSSTTIWKLRTGRQDNPQFRTLTALATFFKVPIGYFGFATETQPLDQDLTIKALARELHEGTIRQEALRALLNLSPTLRPIVEEMVITAARAEQQSS